MESKINSWCVLCLLFTCFFLNPQISAGADTISENQSLSGDQTIVSAGGIFELGFFKPGNSSNNYIGMWYKQVSEKTVVWVANREKPVRDPNSSSLKISGGNLVLLNESQLPIWSTNINYSTGSGSVEAILKDDGNLVLRNGTNSSSFLWHSFDFPTHTLLPGMRIRLEQKTRGRIQILSSWKNPEDPAPGLFSLEVVPGGSNSYFLLWNRSVQYWTTGLWDEKSFTFNYVPEMRSSDMYNFFSYVSNENGSYFTYSLHDPSITSRFMMDFSGQTSQLAWVESRQKWYVYWSQPRERCNVFAFCGAFGICNQGAIYTSYCNCLEGFEPKLSKDWSLESYSGGCQRITELQCGISDDFFEIPILLLPPNSYAATAESIGECQSICSSNCSCTAYAYDNNGCTIWYGDLLNLQHLEDGGTTGKILYLKLAASRFSSSKSNVVVVIGGAIGGLMGLLLLLVFVFLVWKTRKSAAITPKEVEGPLLVFGFRDLQIATKNFSEKIGGGGFGSVFKGALPGSSVIAVKNLESFNQGEKQFRAEVSTIGIIQHVNLVRLRGFCSEGTKKLLVYDYMSNGSLANQLFHDKVLDWATRYNIALGTARGLAYLHDKCRDCIIHCDIKPENILLDAEFCPKVADFGLAKLVGRDFSRVLTTMRGTRGYLAPEWISGTAITAKADVYSYGMMLFEIVSGRRNIEQNVDGNFQFFPIRASSVMTQGGDVLNLLDTRLYGNADIEQLSRICKLACWCIQDGETHRPSMVQVVQILEGVSDVNMPPIPRSLQVFVDNQEDMIFYTETSSSQSSVTRSSPYSSDSDSTTSSIKSSFDIHIQFRAR